MTGPEAGVCSRRRRGRLDLAPPLLDAALRRADTKTNAARTLGTDCRPAVSERTGCTPLANPATRTQLRGAMAFADQ